MKCDLNVGSWTEVQCPNRQNKTSEGRYGLVSSAYVRYWHKANIQSGHFTCRTLFYDAFIGTCLFPNRNLIWRQPQEKQNGRIVMLDYDRLATLFVCLGLLGLFVIVFNVETVLPALRRLTCYLTPSESTAAHAIRHRRKTRRA
jgi:hypothetical protein